MWTKRAHVGGTRDNLFKRKSCKAKVTSRTTQRWGMLACSSLLHCGVATLVRYTLLVKLFPKTDYLGTIFPVLYTVFRTKLSSVLQDWNTIYFSCNTPSCKTKYLCLHSFIYNPSHISQLGVQSFSLIVLILLEVTGYILHWLQLDGKRKSERRASLSCSSQYWSKHIHCEEKELGQTIKKPNPYCPSCSWGILVHH